MIFPFAPTASEKRAVYSIVTTAFQTAGSAKFKPDYANANLSFLSIHEKRCGNHLRRL
jgi:hypothetical protein